MKMWSGRFREPLDPDFAAWQRSFGFDRRLLHYELAAGAAHARTLQKAGILSAEEWSSIHGALEAIGEQAATSGSFLDDTEAEDVHHFVELQLARRIGDAGYKLHTGRSRNEQIATSLRMYVRASIDQVTRDLAEFCSAFVLRAESFGDAPMPSYTHLQRAEPVLAAHWLLAYVEMFLRDAERLTDCRKRLNRCPLGSGAVAGATLALDRDQMATELDFDGPTANSMDATSDRDFALEFTQVLSLLAIHLSRWAEEMILFSSEEFAFVILPEPYSTGSSAMPQKKNPDLLELVRGKCGRMTGYAISLAVTLKGLPLAYNKDMQETQEPVFAAAETMLPMLPLCTRWMKIVEFELAHMQEAAQSGFMNAWAAATYLSQRGVPSRLAHEVVGKAVQMCVTKGCQLQDLPLEELRGLSPAFDKTFYEALTLPRVLAIHDVSGGTAPTRVRRELQDVQARIRVLLHEAPIPV